MAKFKNMRLDDEIQRLITQRMIETGSQNESATVREILLDGLKSPRRPVFAQLGSREELLKFAQLMLAWQQAFQNIRARLAMALPDPDDEELCALVAKWRQLADELEPQARRLSATAAALAKALLGLSPQDCEDIAQAREMFLRFAHLCKQRMVTESGIELAKSQLKLDQYEAVLRVIKLFSGV